MSSPDLPRISLRAGDHLVEVFDPRPDPRALGARYVHGGYIAAWRVGERLLSTAPSPQWEEFGGQGLPETFELPLGWAAAEEHGSMLRIGAGQLRKTAGNGGDDGARCPLSATVAWTVSEQSEAHVTMRTSDATEGPAGVIGYDLERSVRVHADGIDSRTVFTLRAPRLVQHPLVWFAHPFFAQTAVDATSVVLPGATVVPRSDGGGLCMTGDASGGLRFSSGYPRARVAGVWGDTAAMTVRLDPALGGGRVGIALDRPLDHVVVWGAAHVFSPEPKLSRLWLDGETAAWSIRYRFTH